MGVNGGGWGVLAGAEAEGEREELDFGAGAAMIARFRVG
ncbi:MAG: hypothetical protein KatS3mg102_0969 [Planctomycetota bacterium]|nr:MAG: hypothetical protein KatS3mg102_0969 [Planctomycetota bacterium]